ncbi:hypothetical protein C0989_002042 [Termitomyces sp. Mn162]|nr:hypothetical protein C0989_002042 [Termitomyces sp. Mn162]
MSSQVGISVPAALTDDAMEVDDNIPESIMALMHLLAPPWQLYLPLPTGTCPSDTPSTLSSALGQPTAAFASKGKGKGTATLLPTLAQRSSTPLSTTWKIVKQCFSAKEKGKGKVKEPEPLTAMDEQIAYLLQQLHEARVPEDVTLGKEKQIATPPNPPEAKKAYTEPSVFVKGSSTQRAPLVPYDDRVPAGDDQRMDKHPDFKAALSYKGGNIKALYKESWHWAGLSNVPQGAEAGVIKVLDLRTYVMPSVLPQEYRPPVHQDLHDKEFYITQPAAAQAMAGAPVAPDSGSNDDEDDNVSTSK